MKKVAVLSRHKEKENPDKENRLRGLGYDVIVFNKHEGENLLPNVGRESQTYIHYILKNYHDLPDEVLFSQYNIGDHGGRHFFNKNKGDYKEEIGFLHSTLFDFVGWAPNPLDSSISRMRGKPIDYTSFFHRFFGRCDYELINKLISTGRSTNGVFRLSKKAIHRHGISFYEELNKILSHDKDPLEGYLAEQTWKFLFTDYGSIDDSKYSFFKEDRVFLYGIDSVPNKSLGHHLKDGGLGHVKLYSDGNVGLSNPTPNIHYANNPFLRHQNVAHWLIEEDKLYFFAINGGVTSIFDLKNFENWEEDVIEGVAPYNDQLVTWLKPPCYILLHRGLEKNLKEQPQPAYDS